MREEIDGRWVEWDDKKATINKVKHGVSFRTAAMVFSDPDRLEIYDDFHSDEEDRYITIGMVNKILFVVHTDRDDTIRIISAREATAKERRVYYGD